MSAVLVVVLLGRIEPTKRFAVALARGARPGVRMILASISASTASNDAVNFASRWRITNRKRAASILEVHVQVAGLMGLATLRSDEL